MWMTWNGFLLLLTTQPRDYWWKWPRAKKKKSVKENVTKSSFTSLQCHLQHFTSCKLSTHDFLWCSSGSAVSQVKSQINQDFFSSWIFIILPGEGESFFSRFLPDMWGSKFRFLSVIGYCPVQRTSLGQLHKKTTTIMLRFTSLLLALFAIIAKLPASFQHFVLNLLVQQVDWIKLFDILCWFIP